MATYETGGDRHRCTGQRGTVVRNGDGPIDHRRGAVLHVGKHCTAGKRGGSVGIVDGDSERVRRRVEIDAAIGGSAGVLDLEREAPGCRIVRCGVLESPKGNIRGRNELPGRHGNPVVGQSAAGRKRGDLHRQQGIAGINCIGKAEICRRQRVGCVLDRGDRRVRP